MTSNPNTSGSVPGENERFEELGRGCYAYSADACSNSGVIIGDRGVLVVDAQATPDLAGKVLDKIRAITDKPVKQVVLTHFHAENSLGASTFEPGEVVASDLTRRLMDTRGAEEILVSRERRPVLFSGSPHNAAVSLPSMTIASSMSIDLGGLEVRLMHLGRGHTMGDLVVWVPESGVIFAGDLVQTTAVPYCGDAHLADWPRALDRITAFRPTALMPGRGRTAKGAAAIAQAIENTRDFVTTLRDAAAACVDQGFGLKDTFIAVKDALTPQFGSNLGYELELPYNIARAYDEALGLDQPQIWTRERCADLLDALAGVVVAPQPIEDGEPEAPAEVEDIDGKSALADAQEESESLEDETLELTADDVVEIAADDGVVPAEQTEGDVPDAAEKQLESVR